MSFAQAAPRQRVIAIPLPGVVDVRGVCGVNDDCVPSFSGMLALLFSMRRGRLGLIGAGSSLPVDDGGSVSSGWATTRSASEEVPEVLLVEQTLLLRPRERICAWGKFVSSMASFSSLALISDSWRVKLMFGWMLLPLFNLQYFVGAKK